MGICDGRIAIVTGAGRGLACGRLELARQGAAVVVNDLGVELDGSGRDLAAAQAVVDEIVAGGGAAVANGDDVADWAGAVALVATALDRFGGLDVLVNNAGFTRDRMVVSATEDEWDAVVRVDLKGHFAPTPARQRLLAGPEEGRRAGGRGSSTRAAAPGCSAASGRPRTARRRPGSPHSPSSRPPSSPATASPANALAPSARTRMTVDVFAEQMAKPDAGFDAMDPANVAPIVAWLASPDAADVTGHVFELEGGLLSVADGWHHGPARNKRGRWTRPSSARSSAPCWPSCADPTRPTGSASPTPRARRRSARAGPGAERPGTRQA